MTKKEVLFGLLAALFLAMALSPFASQSPDGLEKVAEDVRFIDKGEVEPTFSSPIPDYAWPGISSERLATSSAGVVGTLMVFVVGYGLAAFIRRK